MHNNPEAKEQERPPLRLRAYVCFFFLHERQCIAQVELVVQNRNRLTSTGKWSKQANFY